MYFHNKLIIYDSVILLEWPKWPEASFCAITLLNDSAMLTQENKSQGHWLSTHVAYHGLPRQFLLILLLLGPLLEFIKISSQFQLELDRVGLPHQALC